MNAACSERCGWCGRCTTVLDLVEERDYPDPCDWCEKLIWPGDVLLANHGGRFCGDECAALYAEAEAVGDITRGE